MIIVSFPDSYLSLVEMGLWDHMSVGRLYKSHGLPELHGIKVLVRSPQHVLGTRMFPLLLPELHGIKVLVRSPQYIF
ncbi:hypothetical protein Bca4012_096240 [Brassica carinata]